MMLKYSTASSEAALADKFQNLYRRYMCKDMNMFITASGDVLNGIVF